MLPTTRSDFTFHCWKEFRFTSSPVVFHLNLAIEENVLCLYPSMRSFEESMRHIFESIVFNMQSLLGCLLIYLFPVVVDFIVFPVLKYITYMFPRNVWIVLEGTFMMYFLRCMK